MHISTKDLPTSVRSALNSVGYHRNDIRLEQSEKISACCGGGQDGQRDFVVIVNLSTGEFKTSLGSWGGSNMFNPTNQVDNDTREFDLADGFVVIKGSSGGHGCFATLFASPSTVSPILPAKSFDLTPDQKEVLRIYRTIRSGCRDEYLTGRYKGGYGSYCGDLTDDRVKSALANLSAMGLVKINKSGACSVTTEGKNINLKVIQQ